MAKKESRGIRIRFDEPGRELDLQFHWTTSRARESYGYNICSLYVDGLKMGSCKGGGYDMQGTCLGDFLAGAFADRLRTMIKPGMDGGELYGLTFHDPDYDPGKAVIGTDCHDRTLSAGQPAAEGMTVAQAEEKGISFGLERYQAAYRASTPYPDATHRIPVIDGACGMSSVIKIAKAIGLEVEQRSDLTPRGHKHHGDSWYVIFGYFSWW